MKTKVQTSTKKKSKGQATKEEKSTIMEVEPQRKLTEKQKEAMVKEFVKESEQKNPNKRHNTYNNKWLMPGYMPEILSKTAFDFVYFCDICCLPGFLENLLGHLESSSHRNKTSTSDHTRLDSLLVELPTYLKGTRPASKPKRASSIEEIKEDFEDDNFTATGNYLKFVKFCISERYSFESISRLGKFLANMSKNNQLAFLEEKFYDPEELSHVVGVFKKVILEKLKEGLKESRFSISLDSATLAGQSLCALRVRFLEEDLTEKETSRRIKIKNKILSLSDLSESSKGRITVT